MTMKTMCVLFKNDGDAEALADALKALGINYAKVESVGESYAECMSGLLRQSSDLVYELQKKLIEMHDKTQSI